MSNKGETCHTQDTVRSFGTLFTDLSIDQAARKAIRAAVSWGGMAVVMVDAAGLCSAHMPGMPATDRLIRKSPGALVGTYHVHADDPSKSVTRVARDLISEDIWCHWQQMCDARAADSLDLAGDIVAGWAMRAAA